MGERATYSIVTSVVWTALVIWAAYNGHREGRCQSACWLTGYAYVGTSATVCLCDNDGVPVTTPVPDAPNG